MTTHKQNSASTNKAKFRFRRNDTIGNVAAESDAAFLMKCFVDNQGDFDSLRDCTDQRGIVLGRTGAGKTALVHMLDHHEERVILLDPHDLALGYISNRPVLKFFESLDIKMDLFYRALWRHVIVTAILQRYLDSYNEQERAKPWELLKSVLNRKEFMRKHQAHQDALAYLRTYGGANFWNTTEELIKEDTTKVETELKAAVDAGLQHFLTLGAEGARRLTEEQRRTIRQIGQDVVNRTQISKLGVLFDALDTAYLVDRQKRYFVVVDKLDEPWVDDQVRYRLIRALIETMRDTNSKVSQAKVIIALKSDLFERVLRATTDSGFQGEKYRALCLPIRWNHECLSEMLDRRINQLVENHYAGGQRVTHRDILPDKVGEMKEPTLDYILERTLMRPRDVIAFFNLCLERAEGEATISARQLRYAEERYSRERLDSLADEWSVQYPYLTFLTPLLARRSAHFKLRDITSDQLADISVTLVGMTNPKPGDDYLLARRFYDGKLDDAEFRRHIAAIFYKVGLVGLKLQPYLSTIWSEEESDLMAPADISDTTTIHIHKMFWRTLGINPS